jgi:hypothetical protein
MIGVIPLKDPSMKTPAREGVEFTQTGRTIDSIWGFCVGVGVGIGLIGRHQSIFEGDGVGVGIGVRIVGDDCPMYCEIRSLLLIAMAGAHTRARITTIPIKRRIFFITTPAAFHFTCYIN